MITTRDFSRLNEIVHPDAVFRSPMAHTAYQSAQALTMVLSNVAQIFEDFTYHRELVTADGMNIVLEFSAHIGEKQLKGIDMIRFDENGRIVEFEVMIRPLSSLQALGEEMGRRLGGHLPAFKAK